jgi:periplasmic protein TonB
MKRAFLVSVWFHVLIIVLVVVPTLRLGRRVLRPSAYQVRVVELPPEPAPPAPPRVEPPPKQAPPKPKAAAKPKISPPIRHKAEAPPPLKPKPQPPPEPAPKQEAPRAETPPAEPAPAPPQPSLMVRPKIDAPEFDCSSYCGVLQDKLSSEWKPPPVSAQGPVQAVVVFTINRDGKVDNVSLERSSGNFYFDQAALRAVELAKPLPPLPRAWTGSTLRVHAPFTLQASP